ncbi:hypothetical protein [Candidatus Finniella inopinata]|uniref:Uncharacterized protein n=1 Tax=Candidatus Finniella inopinata TaxID=1696036 RepID=A0A4Q7DI68_9PROT|nr:hypothetical protein [Candidatus Finniella inopinata]RZI45654.1 hypothetical protein EQU50_06010 [Candidatus Finniella inopinata]
MRNHLRGPLLIILLFIIDTSLLKASESPETSLSGNKATKLHGEKRKREETPYTRSAPFIATEVFVNPVPAIIPAQHHNQPASDLVRVPLRIDSSIFFRNPKDFLEDNFYRLLQNRQNLSHDTDFLHRLKAGCAPQIFMALRGYLLMAAERYAEGFEVFTKAGSAITIEAKRNIAKAISENWSRIDCNTKLKCLLYCLQRKDVNAFQQLVDVVDRTPSAPLNSLSQPQETIIQINPKFCNVKAYRALQKLAQAGDQQAQDQINYAAATRQLGFDDKIGLWYLVRRAKIGKKDAQETLIKAESKGLLGLQKNSSMRWFFIFYNAIVESQNIQS